MATPLPPGKHKASSIFELLQKIFHKYSMHADQCWPGIRQWWHYVTLPPPPAAGASFIIREQRQRSHFTGMLLSLLLTMTLAAFPLAFSATLHPLLFVLPVLLLFSLFAIALNRKGKTILVNSLLVIFVNIGLYAGLACFFLQHGLNIGDFLLFDMLVLSELLSLALLPPLCVFLVMLFNCLFILLCLLWQSPAHHLSHIPAIPDLFSAFLQPLLLQLILAPVLYFYTTRARQDHVRACLAIEDSALTQTLQEQKNQLEKGTQQILHTLTQVANGDYSARAPQGQDQTLWQIAASLNTLLNRMQHLDHIEQLNERLLAENEKLHCIMHETLQLEKELSRAWSLADSYFLLSQHVAEQSNDELQQLKGEIALLVRAISTAKTKKQPIWSGQHGSALDPLISCLQGNYLYPFSIPTHGRQLMIIRPEEIGEDE